MPIHLSFLPSMSACSTNPSLSRNQEEAVTIATEKYWLVSASPPGPSLSFGVLLSALFYTTMSSRRHCYRTWMKQLSGKAPLLPADPGEYKEASQRKILQNLLPFSLARLQFSKWFPPLLIQNKPCAYSHRSCQVLMTLLILPPPCHFLPKKNNHVGSFPMLQVAYRVSCLFR